jgi:hypothetical protein
VLGATCSGGGVGASRSLVELAELAERRQVGASSIRSGGTTGAIANACSSSRAPTMRHPSWAM